MTLLTTIRGFSITTPAIIRSGRSGWRPWRDTGTHRAGSTLCAGRMWQPAGDERLARVHAAGYINELQAFEQGGGGRSGERHRGP